MTDTFPLAFGTYAEARAMIGHEQEARYSEVPVSQAMIAFFCALIEDDNPSYWDAIWAESQWGSIVAPPAMVHVWLMPLPWRPQGADKRYTVALSVPLPGREIINAGVDVEYERHVRVGDVISAVERVDQVSPEKTTRLGVGHFVVTSATYRNQDGDLVATLTNTLFRYEPHRAGAR
jgi:acyl dehydratase